jgi:regulator of nonsense transcripts 2
MKNPGNSGKPRKAVVEVCSTLHQTYAGFIPALVEALTRVLEAPPGPEASYDCKRGAACLLTELFLCRAHNDTEAILGMVKTLAKTFMGGGAVTKEPALEAGALLVAFARMRGSPAREEQYGIPETLQEPIEIPEGLEVPDTTSRLVCLAEARVALARRELEGVASAVQPSARFSSFKELDAKLQSGLEHCSKGMAEAFVEQGSCLRDLEAAKAKNVASHGACTESLRLRHKEAKRLFEALKKNAEGMAEALGEERPTMSEDCTAEDEADSNIFIMRSSDLDNIEGEKLFDCEEARLFYEELPNVAHLAAELHTHPGQEGGEADDGGLGQPRGALEEPSGKMEDWGVHVQQMKLLENGTETDSDRRDRLLLQLPKVTGREECDDLSIQLCRLCSKFSHVDSKSSRMAVYKALYPCPWRQMELVPYYARVAATLAQEMPEDFKDSLASHVQRDFFRMCSTKMQYTVEPRICNARMVAELTKFQIMPPIVALKCFRALLDDFSHHNIDVVAALLESVGGFLYRNPATYLRMRNILDILMKLKTVKNLDPRQEHLIDNAYYTCVPPNQTAKKYLGSPLEEYIRDLLSRQARGTVNDVARQLRKMNWDEHQNVAFLVHTMLDVSQGRYSRVPWLARLTHSIGKYRRDFPVFLLDALLEEIRCGLETNSSSMMQTRVAQMRFLGILGGHTGGGRQVVCPLPVVLKALHLIISFGNIGDTNISEAFDPPMDFFRVRLVVSALEGLREAGNMIEENYGRYSVLRRFLLHFRLYILQKGEPPVDLAQRIDDIYAIFWDEKEKPSTATVDAAAAAVRDCEQKGFFEKLTDFSRNGGAKDTFGPSPESDMSEGSEDEDSIGGGLLGSDDEGEGGSSTSGSEVYDSSKGFYGVLQNGGSDSESLESLSSDEGFDECDLSCSASLSGDSNAGDQPTEKDLAEFDRELKSLMQESVGAAKLQPTVVNMVAAPTTAFVRASSTDPRGPGGETDDPVGNAAVQPSMLFHFMARRGGKTFTRELEVPLENKIAQASQNRDAEAAEERSEIKRLVLKSRQQQVEDEEQLVGTVLLSTWQHKSSHAGG